MSRIVMGVVAILVASAAVLVVYCDGQTASAGSLPSASARSTRSTAGSAIKPPIGRKNPKVFNEYDTRRVDNYYWLRERDNLDVIAYLKAENAYADARLKPIQPLANKLYAEMTARHDAPDASVPYFDDGYYYQTRYAKGAEYPVIVRRKGN